MFEPNRRRARGVALALHRPCPACGSHQGNLLYVQRFARIEGVSILDGYEVVACAGCGYCFAHDVPDQAVFDAYYAAASKYDNAAQTPAHDQRRFAAIADDIVRVLPDRGARILDLGCATGGLLAALRARGYRDLHGREPSPNCAATAREHFGLEVQEGSLFEGEVSGAPFDAVILVGVLEHLVDLPGALARLRALLAPDGLAIVEVPDAMAFSQFPDAPFQQFSIEHVGYFSGASMANVFGAYGFAEVAAWSSLRDIVNGQDQVVTGVYRATGAPRAPTAERDTADAIAQYVARCDVDDRLLHDRLAALGREAGPVVVWGCGSLTMRLLAVSPLRDLSIVGFIDGNPWYQGHRLRGVLIEGPEALSRIDASVLVCSFGSAAAIVRAISDRCGARRRVHTLVELG